MRIAKRDEQVIIMGKIEGSAKDSRTMMRDALGDDSEDGNHGYVVLTSIT